MLRDCRDVWCLTSLTSADAGSGSGSERPLASRFSMPFPEDVAALFDPFADARPDFAPFCCARPDELLAFEPLVSDFAPAGVAAAPVLASAAAGGV